MAVSCTIPSSLSEQTLLDPSKQKTLARAVSISGIGLFTAEKARLTLRPAKPGTGITFRRIDLPEKPSLKAILQNVVSTPRCTILGSRGISVHTVEHILAALKASGVDNVMIDLSGPEVPILDGSCRDFMEAIQQAGLIDQDEPREVHRLTAPVYWSKGDIHLVAIPSSDYRISFTLHFPRSTMLHAQFFSCPITQEVFEKEIAPCRTFCVYEEILPFIESGLIKGGGLDNAVIIKNDRVINPEGVRFPDEMVRHKILDLIGDLSLIPCHFEAHIIAIRSGHASNVAFAHELYNCLKREQS